MSRIWFCDKSNDNASFCRIFNLAQNLFYILYAIFDNIQKLWKFGRKIHELGRRHFRLALPQPNRAHKKIKEFHWIVLCQIDASFHEFFKISSYLFYISTKRIQIFPINGSIIKFTKYKYLLKKSSILQLSTKYIANWSRTKNSNSQEKNFSVFLYARILKNNFSILLPQIYIAPFLYFL